MKELENIVPYMWLQPKENNVKAKITGIIPAGSDIAHPYYRYKVEFETGEQIVLKDTVLKMLFSDLGVVGDFKDTFEEACEKSKVDATNDIIDDERAELIEKAKKLGIKSPQLYKDLDRLKAKIEQVELME